MRLPSFVLKTDIHSFTPMDAKREMSAAALNFTSSGETIFPADDLSSSKPTRIMITAMIREVRYSALP